MKTQRRILLVVGVLLAAFAGLVTLAEFLLGAVLGSLVALGVVMIMAAAYAGLARTRTSPPSRHRACTAVSLRFLKDLMNVSGRERNRPGAS